MRRVKRGAYTRGMPLRSLGFRTDAFLARFDGIVEDLGDATSIINPRNPAHYFGNLLIFHNPPRDGDRERWEARYAQTVGSHPGVRHITLAWDVGGPHVTDAALAPFLDAGYTLDENVVMTAESLHAPPRPNTEAELRPLVSDEDWSLALELQVMTREDRWDEASYRSFKEVAVRRYRRMCNAGKGYWYGAFLGGTLAANLGVFVEGTLARFQSVDTHPEYRRRGLCGTLVHYAARHAGEQLGARTFVIVADEHYFAKDVYRSVGFTPVERQQALLKSPETS